MRKSCQRKVEAKTPAEIVIAITPDLQKLLDEVQPQKEQLIWLKEHESEFPDPKRPAFNFQSEMKLIRILISYALNNFIVHFFGQLDDYYPAELVDRIQTGAVSREELVVPSNFCTILKDNFGFEDDEIKIWLDAAPGLIITCLTRFN